MLLLSHLAYSAEYYRKYDLILENEFVTFVKFGRNIQFYWIETSKTIIITQDLITIVYFFGHKLIKKCFTINKRLFDNYIQCTVLLYITTQLTIIRIKIT